MLTNGRPSEELRPDQGQRPLRIAVVGTGYVGLVTGTCFAELGSSVVCVDKDSAKIALLQRGEPAFFEPHLPEMIQRNVHAGRLEFSADVEEGLRSSNVIVIAVGTPIRGDSVDLSAVDAVAAAIGRSLNDRKIVVVKSTVPVGTSDRVAHIIAQNASENHRIAMVSNPEFLREGSAVGDFMHPDRIVVGTNDREAEGVMRALYSPLDAPFVLTDARTGEMIKYASNAFLATKVSFINEIANICDLVGVDVETVRNGMGLDRRIGSRFMSPGIGYGGSCFPKDVRGLEEMGRSRGYSATLLRSVEEVNRAQVHHAFSRVEHELDGSVRDRSVCVLGLSFKPETSDVREAPGIALIELLLAAGASVRAHDPVALENARQRLGDAIEYCSDVYEAVRDCDIVVLATEWNEYGDLDFRAMRERMRGNVVFDGRNALRVQSVIAEGLRYVGIGRGTESPSSAAAQRVPGMTWASTSS